MGKVRADQGGTLSARPTLYLGNDSLEGGLLGAGLHLGLDGRSPEFGPGLRVEAGLSLLAAAAGDGTLALGDNSSWLGLSWRPQGWGPAEGVGFRLLPLHADRLFVGWDYPIASAMGLSLENTLTTGADLRLSRDDWYVFLAAKSHAQVNDETLEPERLFAAFGGGGLEVLGALHLELQAGWADLGANPTTSALGMRVDQWAVAARALYHRGLPVGPPSNWERLRGDPGVWEKLLRPEAYPGGLAVTVSAEGLYLEQRGLADPGAFGATESVQAGALAGEVRVRWDDLRAFVSAQHRTLAFLASRTPGFPPYQAFPDDTEVGPETVVEVAVDYHFERLHLTPGIGGGVTLPASYTTTGDMGGNNPPPALAGKRTIVVSGDGGQVHSILPSNVSALPVWGAKLTLRLDFQWVSALAEGVWAHDPNRYTFKNSAEGVAEPTPDSPTVLGFHLLVQARF